MTKKIILSKFLSREHSLLYYHVWQQSNQNRLINPLFHTENILFIKKPGSGKTSNWYNLKELEDSDKETSEKIKQDLNFFPKVKETYTEYWDKLSPYVKKEKNFKNLEELHEFYINWIKWWIMMVYTFRIPEIESIPKEIREETLKIRKEHEQYSDETDRSLLKGFKKLFPQYKEIADVMTPDEVFSLKEKPLTEKEITNIKQRLNGFAFLNGKLYNLEDLNNALKNENIVLEGMKTTLSKQFSRERSLFYSYMWYGSDNKCFSDWLDHKIRVSLFICPKVGNRTSVWYDPKEYSEIKRKIIEKIGRNKETFKKMCEKWREKWEKILPYLKFERKAQNIEELEEYYYNLEEWWSIMDAFYYIPDLKEIPEEIREKTLQFRKETEEYSDNADLVLVNYVKENFENFADLNQVLTPKEAFDYGKGKLDKENMEKIRERFNGYFALNGEVYLLKDLDKIFEENNLELEKTDKKDISEIKGTVACKGTNNLVEGKVRLILSKDQINELQENEVLVTEMTSPDYLPAMKKSAAIITDEGGVTCHAAIVSRELNKSCIIGTKHSTEILKTGDFVEINTNTGVIKKLK